MSTDNNTKKLDNGLTIKMKKISKVGVSDVLRSCGEPTLAYGTDGRVNPTDPMNEVYRNLWDNKRSMASVSYALKRGVTDIIYPEDWDGLKHTDEDFKLDMEEIGKSVTSRNRIELFFMYEIDEEVTADVVTSVSRYSGIVRESDVGNG